MTNLLNTPSLNTPSLNTPSLNTPSLTTPSARSGLFLRVLLLSISVALVACGGPGTDSKTPATEGAGAGADPAAAGPASPSEASMPTYVALPEIPASAVAAPASLLAEIILSNPNKQLTQVATFVDAVQPGMGAFVTAQTFMQMLEGMNGAVGISGVDLNGPLYILVLDGEKVVIVVTMSSEADLRSSLEGGVSQVLAHDGFAAIGKAEALVEVAPYALSNLVATAKPPLPTMNLRMSNIMQGSQGEKIRKEVMADTESGAEAAGASAALDVMRNLSVLSASLDANTSAATIHMVAKVVGGPLKGFLAKQRPSDYSMLARIGTGPWGLAGAGRLDLSVFSPLLVELGEAEASPVITQIAAQLSSLNGEMAFGLNMPAKPEFALGLELSDAKGIGQVVDTLMGLASKKKDLEIDGMPAKLKLASIKTRAGSLHELKAKPTTKEQIEQFGKRGVSAFFGVAVNTFVATFGANARKHAKALATAKGKIPGKGSKLAAAVEFSKSANESLLFAVDPLSLKGDRPPKDVTPFVLGVGFTEEAVRVRLVVPTAFVKEAGALGLF